MGYATEHLKPWQGRELWSSGALEQHGATRPRGRALTKGFLKPLGDKPSSEGRHWPAKQVGVGAVGPEPTPARSGASMEPAKSQLFYKCPACPGKPIQDCSGLSDPFQVLRPLQMGKGQIEGITGGA